MRATRMTRRDLQVALGLLWLVDAGLQVQPYMFGPHFAHDVISASASGQPGWIGGGVHLAAHLIGAAPILMNALFAVAQLGLGAGLLWRRTARPALAASVAWSIGVWYFGEGLGGLAGGHASLITGLPGPALLYALVALAAWTGRDDRSPSTQPSPAVLASWSVVWTAGALFQALPGQSASRQLASTVGEAGNGGPGWLAALDHHSAGWIAESGRAGIALVVLVELGIALSALGGRHSARVGAALGAVGSMAIWVIGESFGQIYTWHATDPNTGPVLLFMAAAVFSASNAVERPSILRLRRVSGSSIRKRVRRPVGMERPVVSTGGARPYAAAYWAHRAYRRDRHLAADRLLDEAGA